MLTTADSKGHVGITPVNQMSNPEGKVDDVNLKYKLQVYETALKLAYESHYDRAAALKYAREEVYARYPELVVKGAKIFDFPRVMRFWKATSPIIAKYYPYPKTRRKYVKKTTKHVIPLTAPIASATPAVHAASSEEAVTIAVNGVSFNFKYFYYAMAQQIGVLPSAKIGEFIAQYFHFVPQNHYTVLNTMVKDGWKITKQDDGNYICTPPADPEEVRLAEELSAAQQQLAALQAKFDEYQAKKTSKK